MRLSALMSIDELEQEIANGMVTRRFHDDMPWVILNYTPQCQYTWHWTNVTVQCRGLVYDIETNEVVARPFEKFFNWDQGRGSEVWDSPMPPTGPVIRMEKMDGSLGVLCVQHDDQGYVVAEHVATRGSFHSEQAEWATTFYYDVVTEQANTRPQEQVFEPVQGKTYLFEIIYPENRIVVDYGDYKGLVLIDVIDNETGRSDLQEFDDCKWPDKVARKVLNFGFDSGQVAEIPAGDEGFVYLWPEKNYRVKMKSAEYIELHRLVSNLSEKSIWEAMMAGKTPEQIKDGIPDEFHSFVDEAYTKIGSAAADILGEVYKTYGEIIEDGMSRKDFALKVANHPLKKYLFLVLDGKGVWPVALAASKPQSNKALVSQEEA